METEETGGNGQNAKEENRVLEGGGKEGRFSGGRQTAEEEVRKKRWNAKEAKDEEKEGRKKIRNAKGKRNNTEYKSKGEKEPGRDKGRNNVERLKRKYEEEIRRKV